MAKHEPDGPGRAPATREIEALLGRASSPWARLHADVTREFGPLTEQWRYSTKTGRWSLQLKQAKKQRTVLTMILCRGHFLAAFALGEKACRAARASGLPDSMLEAIDAAPRYAEGRGVWIEVRNRRDVGNVARLVRIKMEN
jgi:hypothetical protein